MKIVFCGPPHSGKSVFIANLIDKLPTDTCTVIRACPDGEGNWSNNKGQSETIIVRKKGKFTNSFIEDSCKAIDNQISKIVIIDVGGVISKENEQVFKHCDSFVVLSSDEEKKKEWLEFGNKLGLECIGCLDSKLEGKEEIYSRIPYIQGRMVGLERGDLLEQSHIIQALVSDIIQKSNYVDKEENESSKFKGNLIDDTDFGFELGYGQEIYTEDSTKIKKVKWQQEAVSQVYKAIKEKLKPNMPVGLFGIRANYIMTAICKQCKNLGIKDINTYDIRLKQYIPIKNLPKKRGIKATEGLVYNIIENKENIFMDIDITKEQYSLEDYEKCILPKIKENKNLYLSGRMPLWLLASITNSYNSNRIFTFQPGNGFTCISSKNEKDLGTTVSGVDGIDIIKYYEDKKNKNKSLTVLEKVSIFERIKKIFGDGNSQYVDENIKSRKAEQIQFTENNFQSSLKQSVINPIIPKEISKGKSDKGLGQL